MDFGSGLDDAEQNLLESSSHFRFAILDLRIAM